MTNLSDDPEILQIRNTSTNSKKAGSRHFITEIKSNYYPPLTMKHENIWPKWQISDGLFLKSFNKWTSVSSE